MKSRLVASVALAGALLLGTTGCTLGAVTGTLVHYQPSDGVAANVGDVKVRNLIGLSAGEKSMLAKARQILVSEMALAEKTDEAKAAILLDEVLAS